MLSSLILEKIGCDIDSPIFKEAFEASLQILTNTIGVYEFQRIMSPIMKGTGISAKAFKDILVEHKYLTFNVKCFIYKLASNPSSLKSKLAFIYKISLQDYKQVVKVWNAGLLFQKAVGEKIAGLSSSIPTPAEAERFFATFVYKDVLKYVKKVVYFKCTFLGNLEDSQSEVMFKVVQTFYRQYPSNLEDGHFVGYLKRTAKNHALNIIEKATRKKRGFGIAMSENQASSDSNEEYSLQNRTEYSIDTTEKVINEIFVTNILTQYKRDTKKYRMLLILMGVYDERFSQWLLENKKCRPHEDNSSLQERISPDDFRKILAQFLGMSDKKVDTFLSFLKDNSMRKSNNVTKKYRWTTVLVYAY